MKSIDFDERSWNRSSHGSRAVRRCSRIGGVPVGCTLDMIVNNNNPSRWFLKSNIRATLVTDLTDIIDEHSWTRSSNGSRAARTRYRVGAVGY